MITKTVSKARSNFQDLLNRVGFGNERVVIERHGKPVAAIISYDDFKYFEELEDAIDSAELRRAVEESEGFVSVSLETMLANRQCRIEDE